MRQAFEKNPILSILAIVSLVINLVLGFRAVTQYGISERLTVIETEVKQTNYRLDRLENCIFINGKKAFVEPACGKNLTFNSHLAERR